MRIRGSGVWEKFLSDHALQTLGKHGQRPFQFCFSWKTLLRTLFQVQGYAHLPQVRSIQASAFRSAVYIFAQTGPISLFADLVLPGKFPSTDYFIQSTTIRSSNTLKKRLSALYAVLSFQARGGETTER